MLADVSQIAPDARLFGHAQGASWLWSGGSATPAVHLFGMSFDNATLGEAASQLVADAAAGRRTQVVFVNAHVVNMMRRDAAYRDVVAAAERRLNDGSGMAIAARLAGRAFIDNTNGTDLFPLLCRAAADCGQKIFLLGGRPGVAEAAGETMRTVGLGETIAGSHHGFFARGTAEEATIIDAINASGASILLVALGVPLQDQWIAGHGARLAPAVRMGVGGLFDFYSHSVSRAPLALRSAGLEWAWRLGVEPRRMWRRYIVGNAEFLAAAAVEAARVRSAAVPAGHDRAAA
jgi:exopolysaccharide biosynthesis WecB/TagA/CpsF family protein